MSRKVIPLSFSQYNRQIYKSYTIFTMSKSKDFDIFISYSRKDFDEVNTFLNLLKRRIPGLRCWFDLTGIESGDEFMDKIVTAIDKSDKVLFMVSDNSIMSPWTKKEVIYAENTGHTLIPVLLRGAKLKGWFLFNYGLIDSIDSSDPRQVDKLIDNLKNWQNSSTKESSRNNSLSVDDRRLIAVKQNGKWGYVDTKGNIVIPFKYDNASRFSEGLAKVWNNSGRGNGYIDQTGNLVITSYTGSDFHEGLAVVEEAIDATRGYYKKGYIDKNGSLTIPCLYDHAYDFNEGVAVVGNNWKYGIIDKAGNLISPCIYDFPFNFHDGLAAVRNNKGNYGFINKAGEMVIPSIYTDASGFHNGLAAVKSNSYKCGYIDKNGNTVIPFVFRHASVFIEDLAAVENDSNKWGFIDKSGRIVIPCIYEYAYSFSEGLAKVENKSGKWEFIDKTGNTVIPFLHPSQITSDPYIRDGIAFVCKETGKYGVVDKEGNTVIPFKYEYDEIKL